MIVSPVCCNCSKCTLLCLLSLLSFYDNSCSVPTSLCRGVDCDVLDNHIIHEGTKQLMFVAYLDILNARHPSKVAQHGANGLRGYQCRSRWG